MKQPIRAALVLAAAAALGGCGSGGGDPLRAATKAVNTTLAVKWARYELDVQGPRVFAAGTAATGGRAAYDFRSGLGYEFLQLRRRNGSYQSLFFDYSPTSFLLAPSPAPAGTLPAGKFWISVPVTGPDTDRALVAQAEQLAPLLGLDEVAWGARSASSLGAKVIETVPLREYRVSVDLATALAAARRSGQAGVATAIRQEMDESPSGRLSVLVWVNGPGYVGKIESEVPGSALGTVSFWFLSFTTPYTGAPPAASEVVPLGSLARGGRSLWSYATGS